MHPANLHNKKHVEVTLDDVGELVEKYGYRAHIHSRGEEIKEKGNSGLSSKKMGSRENSFGDEPIPKAIHRVVKESGKRNASHLHG